MSYFRGKTYYGTWVSPLCTGIGSPNVKGAYFERRAGAIATLSVCMIVKDEEEVIGRCLACAKRFADEIIVVDTGSSDKTRQIAQDFTEKIYSFKWIDDFSAARNFSFSKASCDYIMWLDADDVVTDENVKKINYLKNTVDSSVNTIMMKYHVAFDENNKPTLSYYRERMVKRACRLPWVGEIHEVIQPTPDVLYSDVIIEHRKLRCSDPQRNLRIFEKIIAGGGILDARQQFYHARELYYNNRIPEAVSEFLKFLKSDGWLPDKISACRDLSACYILTNEEEKALQALFRSFVFDKPHAEVCCDIGGIFLKREQYSAAIYWYERALNAEKDEAFGFILEDCYNFTPYLQLCVCYDRLGDHAKAEEYNDMAGKVKPGDKAVLYNKKYFDRLFNRTAD